MLYENDNWNSTVNRWSGMGLYNMILARATVYLASGIQFLLRKMYRMLNRQYMLLRREMEFHADAVALAVCGTQTALSTMRRTEMSIFCFENCLQQLPELAEDQLKFRNVYGAHIAMIRYYAGRNNVPLDVEQLPLITDDYFKTFLRSQVQLRDQWASHPTREERERRYKAANIPSQGIEHESAWTLFSNSEQLQEEMSALLYLVAVPDSEDCDWYSTPDFVSDLEIRHLLYALPDEFHEYYNNRPFPFIEVSSLEPLPTAAMNQLSFETLYSPENGLRMRRYFRNRQDAETLQAIADGDIQTRYFEFAGQQYQASHARTELKILLKAIEQDGQWLMEHDDLAFRYHYTQAFKHSPVAANELKEQYLLVNRHEQHTSRLSDIVVKVMYSVSIIFGTSSISIKKAQPYFDMLKQGSDELQTFLRELDDDPVITGLWQPMLQSQISHFLSYNYTYLLENEPIASEIENIHAIISAVQEHYNNSILLLKKALLEMMLPAWDH
jgi:hypothetical protein